MRIYFGGVCVLWLVVLSGCSTDESTREVQSNAKPSTVADQPADPQQSSFTVKPQPITDEIFLSSDSLITLQLERARQHFLSAHRAEGIDSIRATTQFEMAIQLLNDLSYFPGIESNQDFNDLSKAIVEDYEGYIRKSGVVDSASSVFALREKLNQLTDQLDSTKVKNPTRHVLAGTTIPLVVNDFVDQNIEFFKTRGRVHMERWLSRSGKYFPMMKRIMKEEGIPEEIVYLAFVESGMQPSARSWAKAVGLWQFMRGTGLLYDLKGNFWYDDRRDFEKSTRAAARFLKDLYADFEDWYLVMAAYNSGPGKVYRAMRRSGSNDFWEMRSYLPRETRNYVPAYIAVAMIGLNPKEYGFTNIEESDELNYDYVTVKDCIDLETLASCADTKVDALLELNPALLHRCTPPTIAGYTLRIPKSTDKDQFTKKYSAIPDAKKGYVLTHVVKRGETVQKIARHYGVSQQLLAESNELSPRARLKRGLRLLVPIARGGRSTIRLAANIPSEEGNARTQSRTLRASASDRQNRTRETYKVKRGDTLGEIAERFGVRAADIRNWNNLPYGSTIRTGTKLTLYAEIGGKQKSLAAKQSKGNSSQESGDDVFEYAVKSGDSLDKIAKQHGVAVAQLERWNNLRGSRIKPGEILILYPRVAKVNSPVEKSVADAKAHSKGTSNQIIYIVRKGDTISEIAQAHEVQESQLRTWNSLKRRSRIYAGQELVIRIDAY